MYRDVLSSASDAGIVVVDSQGRVRLWNEAATRFLGVVVTPRAPAAAQIAPEIARLVTEGRACADESAVIRGRTLRITRRPVIHRGRTVAQVTFLHDRTETLRLAAQLDAEREATIALRARAHEADNRLHTVVSLVELGHVQEAVDFATAVLARSREMHESVHSTVADPVLAALLMGKAVRADEAGVALHVDPATTVPSTGLPSQDLVLLLGNLIDNGIDAAAATPPPRWVHLLVRASAESVCLEVSDSGPGLAPDAVYEAFRPGWTTKTRSDPGEAHGQGLGLALVAEALQRLGGTVTVDRWVGARFVVEVPLYTEASVK